MASSWRATGPSRFRKDGCASSRPDPPPTASSPTSSTGYRARSATESRSNGASFRYGNRDSRSCSSPLAAGLAARTGSPDLAARAWREFSSPPPAHGWVSASHPDWWSVVEVGGPTVLQRVRSAVNISTNDAAQYGLAAIQLIALLGDPPASE